VQERGWPAAAAARQASRWAHCRVPGSRAGVLVLVLPRGAQVRRLATSGGHAASSRHPPHRCRRPPGSRACCGGRGDDLARGWAWDEGWAGGRARQGQAQHQKEKRRRGRSDDSTRARAPACLQKRAGAPARPAAGVACARAALLPHFTVQKGWLAFCLTGGRVCGTGLCNQRGAFCVRAAPPVSRASGQQSEATGRTCAAGACAGLPHALHSPPAHPGSQQHPTPELRACSTARWSSAQSSTGGQPQPPTRGRETRRHVVALECVGAECMAGAVMRGGAWSGWQEACQVRPPHRAHCCGTAGGHRPLANQALCPFSAVPQVSS
jgi:hypothetical protein